jgi:hypothetical protein
MMLGNPGSPSKLTELHPQSIDILRFKYLFLKIYSLQKFCARCWWLMPIILATQEAEIRSIWLEVSLGK